ncbi:MAG: UPF0175 family protein [bacterium]|nr:UPF0175 family protein [bacterium]
MISPQALVDAGLYPDEHKVIQEAMKALWHERPQLRIDWAIHQYQTRDISLSKAAALANVSFDRMKELLVQRGIQPRLGPENLTEARQEMDVLEALEKRP